MQQPDLVLIERQKLWEIDGVRRGVRRFREGLRDAGLMSTTAGLSAAQDIVRSMVPEIERMQKTPRPERGRDYQWLEIFQLLPADTLAVLTVNTIFAQGDKVRGYDKAWGQLALAVASNTRLQVEYEQWEDAEAQRRKEARASKAPYADMRERLRRSTKNVDRKAWSRFKRRMLTLTTEPWSPRLRLIVGTALLTVAVEHGGGWFRAIRIAVPGSGGKTELRLQLTEPAVAAFEDMLTRNELARPMRVPMIAPPRPWIRKETT